MKFLENVKVALEATGTAAFLCVLVICITVIAIFGSGPLATTAMTSLTVVLAMSIWALGRD